MTGVLLATAWGGVTYAWDSPEVLAAMTIGAAGLVVFLAIERRAREPLLALELFRRPVFAVASSASLVIGTLLFGRARAAAGVALALALKERTLRRSQATAEPRHEAAWSRGVIERLAPRCPRAECAVARPGVGAPEEAAAAARLGGALVALPELEGAVRLRAPRAAQRGQRARLVRAARVAALARWTAPLHCRRRFPAARRRMRRGAPNEQRWRLAVQTLPSVGGRSVRKNMR